MEIRDYILNEQELEKLRTGKRDQKRGRIRAEYGVLFQSGCDFGIEKRAGKRISRLIILVSRKQYYISEGNTIKALTIPLLRKFLKEVENGIPLPDVYWLGGLCNDQYMAGRILKVLRNPNAAQMLKKGTIYIYSDKELNCRRAEYEDYLNDRFGFEQFDGTSEDTGFYHWSIEFLAKRRGVTKKQLFQEMIGLEAGKKETAVLKSFETFRYIYHMYGPDWGKMAVEKYMSSVIEDIIDKEQVENLLEMFAPNAGFDVVSEENADFKPETFDSFEREAEKNRKDMVRRLPAEKLLEYLMFHSCKEGYAFSMDEFLTDWVSCLKMQKELYGKIRDKYPQNLKSSLKRLSYEYKLHKDEISRKQWEIAADKMRELEYSDNVYLIKSPRCKEDLAQEASHQHNCVLDYAEKVRRGEEQILFMRKCAKEEEPLVTLEVFPDGRVGQVFRAFNSLPSNEEMKFLEKWAKAKNLIMPENPLPPRGANNFMNNDLDGVFGGF